MIGKKMSDVFGKTFLGTNKYNSSMKMGAKVAQSIMEDAAEELGFLSKKALAVAKKINPVAAKKVYAQTNTPTTPAPKKSMSVWDAKTQAIQDAFAASVKKYGLPPKAPQMQQSSAPSQFKPRTVTVDGKKYSTGGDWPIPMPGDRADDEDFNLIQGAPFAGQYHKGRSIGYVPPGKWWDPLLSMKGGTNNEGNMSHFKNMYNPPTPPQSPHAPYNWADGGWQPWVMDLIDQGVMNPQNQAVSATGTAIKGDKSWDKWDRWYENTNWNHMTDAQKEKFFKGAPLGFKQKYWNFPPKEVYEKLEKGLYDPE